jgi:hypothetical protein
LVNGQLRIYDRVSLEKETGMVVVVVVVVGGGGGVHVRADHNHPSAYGFVTVLTEISI